MCMPERAYVCMSVCADTENNINFFSFFVTIQPAETGQGST